MYIHDLCWNVNRDSSVRSEFLYPTCKLALKIVTWLHRERKNMFLWIASSDLCIVKGTWKGRINWQSCELQHRQMPSPTSGEEMLLPPIRAEHWPATKAAISTPKLWYLQHLHQDRRGDPCPPLSSDEVTPALLNPVLGPSRKSKSRKRPYRWLMDCHERLRERAREMKAHEDLIHVYETEGDEKKKDQQWYPLTGQEATEIKTQDFIWRKISD